MSRARRRPTSRCQPPIAKAPFRSAEDQAEWDRHQARLTAQFLIDREGVVRWRNIERALAEFPSDAELLATVAGTR